MIDDGVKNKETKPPTRELIVEWTHNVSKDLTENIVQNAWLHGPYTCFPDKKKI